MKRRLPFWCLLSERLLTGCGRLATLRLDPQCAATADVLLRLTLQAWPQSAMAFFNELAYATLGIPSMVYGALLWRPAAGAQRRGLHPGRDWLADGQCAAGPGRDGRRCVVSGGLVPPRLGIVVRRPLK